MMNERAPIRPPVEISWLVQILGEDGALRLIEEAGGTRVYVSATPDITSSLTMKIGLDGARQMADALLAHKAGGIYIKVPLVRAWRIRLYRARGHSIRDIARALGVHESTVERHLKAAEMTGQPQPDLFG